MPQLEVFFDYACPFCLKGHNNLEEVISRHPQVEILWNPCEAHPRPEAHGPHSDLCIRAMFFAQDNGADLNAFHRRMYQAALEDRINIEDPDVLADYVQDLVDADALGASLKAGEYVEELEKSNKHAYEESGVWAVPSYRMDGRKLDAAEGIGVRKEDLDAFLA